MGLLKVSLSTIHFSSLHLPTAEQILVLGWCTATRDICGMLLQVVDYSSRAACGREWGWNQFIDARTVSGHSVCPYSVLRKAYTQGFVQFGQCLASAGLGCISHSVHKLADK